MRAAPNASARRITDELMNEAARVRPHGVGGRSGPAGCKLNRAAQLLPSELCGRQEEAL
jgi:hypothetical protein